MEAHLNCIGASSGGGDPQSIRADVEEDQLVEIHQPLQRPDRLGEKVVLPVRSCVGADEFCPLSAAAIRDWRNAVCLEDRLHGLPRDVRDAEFTMLIQDAGVSPAVFTGESQNEFANVWRSRGARYAALGIRERGDRPRPL